MPNSNYTAINNNMATSIGGGGGLLTTVGGGGSLYNGVNGTSASQFVFANTAAAPSFTNSIVATSPMSAPDIILDGVSMKDTMAKITERLAILVPDPAKLEKFAALKAAYEHYKLLEKLCTEP
jgi:hypothetical protein